MSDRFDEVDLDAAFNTAFNPPLPRAEHEYGASGIGFCKEKAVLRKRLNIPWDPNWRMTVGKVFHWHNPDLVRATPYGRAHGLKFWARPRYEVEARHDDPRGFTIRGHVDVDLPALDRIVELKFTFGDRVFVRGDFITEAYILQANAYAALRGRSSWEIWVYHMTFDRLSEHHIASHISGETNEAELDYFLEQVWFIDQALRNGVDLEGPEQSWECKYCAAFFVCPHHGRGIGEVMDALPCAKRDLDYDRLQRQFELLKAHGVIEYDRSAKVWQVIDDE